MAKSIIEGNWEVYATIGTRIEIYGDRILILWRNSPVTDTSFKTEEKDDKIYLILKNTDMKYTKNGKPYATVESLYYDLKDNKLHFIENFPITGLSEDELVKTETSRYGNYKIVDDEILPLLNGTWVDEEGSPDLVFYGNTVFCDQKKAKIHILKSNSSFNGSYKIAHEDPSKYEILYFYSLEYSNDTIRAIIPICDAKPIVINFKKKQ